MKTTEQTTISSTVALRAFIWGFATLFDFYKTSDKRSQEIKQLMGDPHYSGDYWSAVGGYIKGAERKHGKEISRECWAKN